MADILHCPCCNAGAKHWFCTPDGLHTSEEPRMLYGKFTSHHIIRCTKCGLQTKVYGTAKGAFNSWNRRVKETD